MPAMNVTSQKCLVGCVLAAAIVGSWVVISIMNVIEPNVHQRLHDTLDDRQRVEYAAIVRERGQLFGLGLLAAIVFIGGLMAMETVQKVHLLDGCTALLIAAGLVVAVYTLYPKRRYLIEILDRSDQRVAWANVYRHMQLSMWVSAIIIAVGAGALSTYVSGGFATQYAQLLVAALFVGLVFSMMYKFVTKRRGHDARN